MDPITALIDWLCDVGHIVKPQFPIMSNGMIKMLFGELVERLELKEVKNPAQCEAQI